MNQNFSLLLYEKEKNLNSILQYQISNYKNYEVVNLENHEESHDIITYRRFDISVLNLNDFGDESQNFLDILISKNENINIIAYHEPSLKKVINNVENFFLLEKPFKLITLLNYLDSINNTKILHNSNKYLMEHIVFSPSKKTISNLKTNYTEHLTEKENNLLIYLYSKKNEEIKKRDILNKIWGFSENINTHTLETHIYRLKQKLNKIDKNLSLSLKNKNGLYYLKYNN